MNIKVSSASSFFQEKGHDAHGIFQLLFNAVMSEACENSMMNTNFCGNGLYDETRDLSYLENKDKAYRSIMITEIENFTYNPDMATKRIHQFSEDHNRLKKLNQKINKLGFWQILFRWKPEVRKLFFERNLLTDMTITLEELINIACYKYIISERKSPDEFEKAFKNYFS